MKKASVITLCILIAIGIVFYFLGNRDNTDQEKVYATVDEAIEDRLSDSDVIVNKVEISPETVVVSYVPEMEGFYFFTISKEGNNYKIENVSEKIGLSEDRMVSGEYKDEQGNWTLYFKISASKDRIASVNDIELAYEVDVLDRK
mgnify:CR=1 FL=1|jgi:hypothetical protein